MKTLKEVADEHINNLLAERKIQFNRDTKIFLEEANNIYNKYRETIYGIIYDYIIKSKSYKKFRHSRILVDAINIFPDIFKYIPNTKKPTFVKSTTKQAFDLMMERFFEENGLSTVVTYEIKNNNVYFILTVL